MKILASGHKKNDVTKSCQVINKKVWTGNRAKKRQKNNTKTIEAYKVQYKYIY